MNYTQNFNGKQRSEHCQMAPCTLSPNLLGTCTFLACRQVCVVTGVGGERRNFCAFDVDILITLDCRYQVQKISEYLNSYLLQVLIHMVYRSKHSTVEWDKYRSTFSSPVNTKC
jgi:hypothetical protein